MTKRTALYMVAGALLVPMGATVVLLVMPNELSVTDTFATVFNRVRGRPVPMVAFAFWMAVFALLGGFLARLGTRREVA